MTQRVRAPRRRLLRRGLLHGGMVLAMFLYVYDISFVAAPSLTTRRLTMVLLLPFLWRTAAKLTLRFCRDHSVALFTFVLLFFYSVVLYMTSGRVDTTQMSRFAHFLIDGVLASMLFVALVRGSARAFAMLYMESALLQTVMIGISFFSQAYRYWLAGLVVQAGNIPIIFAQQVPGFSNSSGALLSMQQGVGVFAAFFAARYTKSKIGGLLLYAAGFLIALSTLVTGRTGLVLAVAFVGVFAVASRPRQVVALAIVVALAAGLLSAYSTELITAISRYNSRIGVTVEWAFEVFHRGTETESVVDLAGQRVPPITMETLLGTGIITLPSGISATGNDSGYVHLYYAIGLIMTVVFYVAFAAMLLVMLLRTREPFVLGALIVAIFALEVKEPFIFKYSLPFFVIGLLRCSARSPVDGRERGRRLVRRSLSPSVG